MRCSSAGVPKSFKPHGQHDLQYRCSEHASTVQSHVCGGAQIAGDVFDQQRHALIEGIHFVVADS